MLILLIIASNSAVGSVPQSELALQLKKEISKNYSGAQIRLESTIKWVKGTEPKSLQSVSILGDDGKGSLHFIARSSLNATEAEGAVDFSARVIAKVAVKRVRPGELLREDMFMSQLVDLSTGMVHESRGILFSENVDSNRLEAVQTILEGQLLTSVAVQRVPDVRRGDSIQIHLVSSGMVITTGGVAEEAGYVRKRIRVMTSRSKRELTGLLQAGGIVEVTL